MDITSLPSIVAWGAFIIGVLFVVFKMYIWWMTKGKIELQKAVKQNIKKEEVPVIPVKVEVKNENS